MQPNSPSQAALLARWRAWVAAKVQGEAQPQGGQAGQAGGVVIRFPVERRR
jgi:hypothetical protein